MRLLSFLFLAVFLVALAVFAYLNNDRVNVNLFGRVFEVSFPLLVFGIYVLGMFTGWAVVGMLRKSWRRLAEDDRRK